MAMRNRPRADNGSFLAMNAQCDKSARLASSSIAPRPAVGDAGAGAVEREPWDLVRRW